MTPQEQNRPDPDALLAAVQREEERESRGKLKIFFGMAAGVGKTYAMLQAAQELKARGVNVVVAYIETHKRKETEALLQGLVVVPRIKREYRGIQTEEMDLDAVIALNPEFALVDELAHTNAEGSRHPKRYQDVLELLDNNISVYTTLNVQHVESLVDTVRDITGASLIETVPDSILDVADDIELIDLPPEELLKRMNEGKVYTAERTVAALQNFFKEGTLTALREISLRKTAEHVGKQLQDFMQVNREEGQWKTIDRLLVGISASPYSEYLIRWTRRVASAMEVEWFGVHVQSSQALSADEEERLKKNITLARELGATEIIATADEDVAAAFLRVARQRNITQIVVGKSRGNRLRDFLRGGSLVDRLLARSGDIDVCAVQDETTEARTKTSPWRRFRAPLRQYIYSCALVSAVALACFFAGEIIEYRSVGMVLLFTISLLALFAGRGPILAAAAISAVIFDYFFIPPIYTFYISSTPDALLVVMYFFTAIIGGTLTARVRAKEFNVRRRERQTLALYRLARSINKAESIDDIIGASLTQIGTTFDAKTVCYLKDDYGALSHTPHTAGTIPASSVKEWSVALWVFENGKPAGRGTDTLPFADAVYYPLVTSNGSTGVIGIALDAQKTLPFEQETLLQAFLDQIALAIERESLRRQSERTHLLAESERLYKSLLNSIATELRTPLTTISEAAEGLMDKDTADNALARNTLAGDIHHAAYRLNHLVDNLLDLTSLESGVLKLNKAWHNAGDLLHTVTLNLSKELSNHKLTIDVPEQLPKLNIDFILVEQAISNILLNAAQYTPTGTNLRLSAYAEAKNIVITIDDEGPGFSQDALEHLFEKFYHEPGTEAGGAGMGLSITRGFIEANGGTVTAVNRQGGGARFIIRLPVPDSQPLENTSAL